MADQTTQFVVSRLTWRFAGLDRILVRMPGETRVTAFADFDSATADRVAREGAARALVNPFNCGTTWAERSHLPEPVFRDFIKDAGVEPPTFVVPHAVPSDPRLRLRHTRQAVEALQSGFVSWDAWWTATAPALSVEQTARVWEGLDRVRFFSVEEQPARPVAFVVVEISWNYNDEWNYPPPEGGGAHTAFRTRARAEAECARMNRAARERWRRDLHLPPPGVVPDNMAGHEAFPFDMQDRPFPGDDPLGPRRVPPVRGDDDDRGKFAVDEVPFYEVIEFELSEGE